MQNSGRQTELKEVHCKNRKCRAALGLTDDISFFYAQGGISIKYLPLECAKCGETTLWKRLKEKNCLIKAGK